MKFLIIGDLHGNKPEIFFKNFDAIIAPGDFCSDAPRQYMFQALKAELQDAKSKVTWYDLVGKKEAKTMVKKSLADGRRILEFLNAFDVPVFVVPGNWDWTGSGEKWNFLRKNYWLELIRGLKNIVDVHHKIVSVDKYMVIGHGITSGPEYPQTKEEVELLKKKRELAKTRRAYESQKGVVSALFQQATKPVIFMPHNVPYNTPIDQINNPQSPRNGQHFGSLIAREMIDYYQPLVCIGGHMHEHFTSCMLGKTICINAGFGSFVNVWLELEGTVIKKLEFHKGDIK